MHVRGRGRRGVWPKAKSIVFVTPFFSQSAYKRDSESKKLGLILPFILCGWHLGKK